MASILFLSQLFLQYVAIRLEKVSMKLGSGNFVKIVSQSYSIFVFGTQVRLQYFFLTQIYLHLVGLEKKDMKQNFEKIMKRQFEEVICGFIFSLTP